MKPQQSVILVGAVMLLVAIYLIVRPGPRASAEAERQDASPAPTAIATERAVLTPTEPERRSDDVTDPTRAPDAAPGTTAPASPVAAAAPTPAAGLAAGGIFAGLAAATLDAAAGLVATAPDAAGPDAGL